MTVGYKEKVREDLRENLAGVSHILALSVMCGVTVLWGLLCWILRPLDQVACSMGKVWPHCILLLLWTFAFLVGFWPPSVFWAVVMCMLMTVFVQQENRTLSLNTLAIAAFVYAAL